jgi:hypothetical protein
MSSSGALALTVEQRAVIEAGCSPGKAGNRGRNPRFRAGVDHCDQPYIPTHEGGSRGHEN